jgi:hypothetical protein
MFKTRSEQYTTALADSTLETAQEEGMIPQALAELARARAGTKASREAMQQTKGVDGRS